MKLEFKEAVLEPEAGCPTCEEELDAAVLEDATPPPPVTDDDD